jgi:hypothetical protein
MWPVREIYDPQPPGALRGCPGLYGDSFIFALHSIADRSNFQNTAQ